MIKVKHSTIINTILGYNSNVESSKFSKTGTGSYLNTIKGSTHQNDSSKKNNEGSNISQENKLYHNQRGSYSRRYYTPRYSYFNGQCFTCHYFGHKVFHCVTYKTIMTREERNQKE